MGHITLWCSSMHDSSSLSLFPSCDGDSSGSYSVHLPILMSHLRIVTIKGYWPEREGDKIARKGERHDLSAWRLSLYMVVMMWLVQNNSENWKIKGIPITIRVPLFMDFPSQKKKKKGLSSWVKRPLVIGSLTSFHYERLSNKGTSLFTIKCGNLSQDK